MSPDERMAAEMTQLAIAFKQIGGSLDRLAIVAERWYDKTYPEKVPREATVTHVKSDADKLRESLGISGDESIEQWTTLGVEEDSQEENHIGPRERDLIKRKAK